MSTWSIRASAVARARRCSCRKAVTARICSIIGVLRGIREGVDAGQAMAAAFDALGLIQPVRLDVALDASHATQLQGCSPSTASGLPHWMHKRCISCIRPAIWKVPS